jgi:hypothetical protein
LGVAAKLAYQPRKNQFDIIRCELVRQKIKNALLGSFDLCEVWIFHGFCCGDVDIYPINFVGV